MQVFKKIPGEHAPGPPKTVADLILLHTKLAGKSMRSKTLNFNALP